MKTDLRALLSGQIEALDFDQDSSLTQMQRGGDTLGFNSPIRVQGRLSRLEDGVVFFSGRLDTVVKTVCGRCLEPVLEPFSIEFGEVVYADGKEEEYDLIIEPEGPTFDLDAFCEAILELNLPVSFLCREDCKGLCPICGTNLNTSECNCKENQIDQRFAKLKDLLQESKNK